jgi:hypothetical protein
MIFVALDAFELKVQPEIDHVHHAEEPVAEPVGDPYVALTVDGEAAAVVADLKILGLARI